jgi:hypothetical protein
MISLFLFYGCREGTNGLFYDYSDVMPRVEIESFSMNSARNLTIKVRIFGDGKSDLTYIGTCMSNDSTPEMLDNQQLTFEIYDDCYYIDYNGLTPLDTYYFRPFIANDYGYCYGKVVRFIVPKPQPPYIPCILQNNDIYFNLVNYSVSDVYSGKSQAISGEWGCYVSTFKGMVMHLDFKSVPENGIYSTKSSSQLYDVYDVIAKFNTGWNTYYALPGGKIYVEQDSLGKYTFTFCELKYTYEFDTFTCYGRFTE